MIKIAVEKREKALMTPEQAEAVLAAASVMGSCLPRKGVDWGALGSLECTSVQP